MENQFNSVLHMNSLVCHYAPRLTPDVTEPMRSAPRKPRARARTTPLATGINRGISFWELQFPPAAPEEEAKRVETAVQPPTQDKGAEAEVEAEAKSAAIAEEESAEASPRQVVDA
jgi:hypothetical protein